MKKKPIKSILIAIVGLILLTAVQLVVLSTFVGSTLLALGGFLVLLTFFYAAGFFQHFVATFCRAKRSVAKELVLSSAITNLKNALTVVLSVVLVGAYIYFYVDITASTLFLFTAISFLAAAVNGFIIVPVLTLISCKFTKY